MNEKSISKVWNDTYHFTWNCTWFKIATLYRYFRTLRIPNVTQDTRRPNRNIWDLTWIKSVYHNQKTKIPHSKIPYSKIPQDKYPQFEFPPFKDPPFEDPLEKITKNIWNAMKNKAIPLIRMLESDVIFGGAPCSGHQTLEPSYLSQIIVFSSIRAILREITEVLWHVCKILRA